MWVRVKAIKAIRAIGNSSPFLLRGVLLLQGSTPPLFLESSTLITLITLITTFKPLILRCISSDQGRMRGKTLQCALITLIWLKVLS